MVKEEIDKEEALKDLKKWANELIEVDNKLREIFNSIKEKHDLINKQ